MADAEVSGPREAPSRSVRANRITSFVVFAALALAPLPFGSTGPATIMFWCIFLGIGLIAASPQPSQPTRGLFFCLVAVLFAAYAFVLHEQLATWPWLAQPYPLWSQASDALGVAVQPAVSIARHQPFFALGAPLAAVLVLMASFVVCHDRRTARQLVLVLAWSGAAYAIFGIVSFLIDPARLLWTEKQAYRTVLTATFINRNTAAVYFGSCAIIWLLLMSEILRPHFSGAARRWRIVVHRLLMAPPRQLLIAFSMFFVCLVAMFLTVSRAGVLLSLATMLVGLGAFVYRDLRFRKTVVAVIAAVGLATLVLLQFLGAGVGGRLDAQGLSSEGRFETYRSTVKMIAEHPWFGSGQGTFAWDFPSYRSAALPLWGTWDRAHDTLLELASDLGLPMALLIGVLWVIVLAVLVRGVRTRQRDRIIPAAALAVATLALTHSLIDFSLQIPGYAIPVFALVGAGLAQSFSSVRRPERRRRPVPG